MAQRDYVSRGRAPQNKKKNTRNTKPAAPVSPAKKWMRLVIPVVGFALLGYFLFSIKDNGGEKIDSTAAPMPQVVTPGEELPEMPQEEWEYIKSLPGYEVEVEVAEQQKSDKLYLLQCGSFRTRAQAEEMKAKIAFQGMESQIRPSSGTNGDWFRVILGPLQSKRDAERARHSLRKVNITTCMMLYWNL